MTCFPNIISQRCARPSFGRVAFQRSAGLIQRLAQKMKVLKSKPGPGSASAIFQRGELAISRQKFLQQELLCQTGRYPFRGANAEIGEHQAQPAIRLRIVQI